MQKNCKCGQDKLETIQDGRFAYHECSVCGQVTNIIYLGPKPESEWDEELLGL
jgi:hypothetical protein